MYYLSNLNDDNNDKAFGCKYLYYWYYIATKKIKPINDILTFQNELM